MEQKTNLAFFRSSILKRFFSIIFFIILVVILYSYVNKVFLLKDRMEASNFFVNEPKNSIDVLFLGSSHVLCGINPLIIWNEQQITSYSLATNAQMPYASLMLARLSQDFQKPKLIVLDVYMFLREVNFDASEWNHKALDPFPLTLQKAFFIIKTERIQNKLEFLFPLVKYHSRLMKEELSNQDFLYPLINTTSLLKGYSYFDSIYEIDFLKKLNQIIEKKAIQPENEKTLLEIIQWSKDNHIPLLLTAIPYQTSLTDYQQINYIASIAEQNKVPFLDLNKRVEEIGILSTTDFKDEGHTNVFGAEKISSWFGRYLASTYNLNSSKKSDILQNWNDAYAYYDNIRHLKEIIDLTEYLNRIDNPHYVSVLTGGDGDYDLLPREAIEKLQDFGFIGNKKDHSTCFIGIIDQGKSVVEKHSRIIEANYPFNSYLHDYLYIQNSTTTTIPMQVKLNHEIVATYQHGLNILVYDKEKGLIIDNVTFDPQTGLKDVKEPG